MRRLGRCHNPLHGEIDVVEGLFWLTSRILDRAANQPCLGRQPDSFSDHLRCIAESFSQIRGHW
jgi:hypothetical protein